MLSVFDGVIVNFADTVVRLGLNPLQPATLNAPPSTMLERGRLRLMSASQDDAPVFSLPPVGRAGEGDERAQHAINLKRPFLNARMRRRMGSTLSECVSI